MTELLSEISVTLRYGNMTSVSDGLGRALRTAKTGEVYDRASDSKRTGWNVSGAVEYDAMGRIASQGQPYFIEGGLSALALDSGSFTAPTIRPTLTEYDSLDRVIRTELPGHWRDAQGD